MTNLIHTEVRDGFTIQFFAESEELPLSQLFDGGALDDVAEQIEKGALVVFCAKVTASKNGIELARDYLGQCVYEDAMDFVSNGDYYGGMVRTVIADAKAAIIALQKEDA